MEIIHSQLVKQPESELNIPHAEMTLYYSGILDKIDKIKEPIKWAYFWKKYVLCLDNFVEAAEKLYCGGNLEKV